MDLPRGASAMGDERGGERDGMSFIGSGFRTLPGVPVLASEQR